MAFDYKKEYRDLYQPASQPSIITVPRMNFVAVEGVGDPNEAGGAYQTAVQLLYGISYTIKMNKKSKDPSQRIDGYFDYVVPPLEGLWWMDGINGVDYAHKNRFNWIAMIRLPEFVTREVFARARQAYSDKHPEANIDRAFLFEFDEGTVVQAMHHGPYDDEPTTVAMMDAFATGQGYELDFTQRRHHHEIYLGDPRRGKPENLKTVIRHPVRPTR